VIPSVWQPDPERPLVEQLGLGAEERARLKRYLRIGPEDERLLVTLQAVVAREADRLVDAFYDHLLSFGELAELLDSPAAVERLKGAQKYYLLTLVGGEYEEEYFEQRLRLGAVHERVGLEPQWYSSTYALFMDLLTPLAEEAHQGDPSAARGAMLAVYKFFQLDLTLALDIYFKTRYGRELARSEERYRTVFEQTRDGILLVDPDSCRLVRANPAARRLLGASEELLTGMDVRLLFHGALASPQELETLSRHAGPLGTEIDLVTAEGRRVAVELSASRIRLSGGEAFLCVLHDLSERKRLEQRAVDSERLAAIGEMAASVAHEVRNPLTGILGALEVIRPRFAPDDPAAEIMGEIRTRLDDLNDYIQDLLLYAKPVVVERKELSFLELAQQSLSLLRVAEGESGSPVEVHDRIGPQGFLADPFQLQQALSNLVLNALHAVGEREGGRVLLTGRLEGDQLLFEVEDEGPGIPEGLRERIFQPFFTTKRRGSGLGLAITRRIFRAHGGDLVLDPQEGRTLFRGSIPLLGEEDLFSGGGPDPAGASEDRTS
jgi:PAS domain S-box-containing protein